MQYTDEFEKCWAIYPSRITNGKARKVGKKQAFEQWQKITNGERRLIKTDIEHRNKRDAWGDPKYIVDMVRYIRHRRWEDQDEAPELKPRPSTYNEPEVKLHSVVLHANRAMVKVIMDFCGVDYNTLCKMYRKRDELISEFHEKHPTQEFIDGMVEELSKVAQGVDRAQREIEVAKAQDAFRVKMGHVH